LGEVFRSESASSHLKQNPVVRLICIRTAGSDDKFLFIFKLLLSFVLFLLGILLLLCKQVLFLVIFELNGEVADGVLAEVSNGAALSLVCLELCNQVADALQGKNALQVYLRVEFLPCKIELFDSLRLLSEPTIFVSKPASYTTAESVEEFGSTLAPVAEFELFTTLEFLAKVFSPVSLTFVFAFVVQGHLLIVERFKRVHMIAELLVVEQNQPRDSHKRECLRAHGSQSSHHSLFLPVDVV
jgi:hypothetical protein